MQEAIEALAIRPDGVYIDATFGRGGHSAALLERLGPEGRLLALDRDPEAIAAAGAAFSDTRLSFQHRRFGEIADAAREAGWQQVDGVLFDLGVSSPQLDTARRGFSFRFEAPLDMRMDTTRGETAEEWLARAKEDEIAEVIRVYGEERFALQIAKKIVAARRERPVATTGQLATLVREAVRTREPGQDPATRTFQAVRIHLNQELAELALALPQASDLLRPGGRLVVISFHSLEDRIVKRFMRDAAHPAHPGMLPRDLPLRATELPAPQLRLIGKAVKPVAAEIALNPRARSAMMRIAEKCGAKKGVDIGSGRCCA